MNGAKFHNIVKEYYHDHGRDLPWRRNINPYRIIVSEIMLQQTQVSRVLVKYPEFLRRFPTWKSLASASTADVIKAWQGLGYNRRALALKEIAAQLVKLYSGRVPKDTAILYTLPGIGPATANSIVTFAFNQPVVFIETNIRRVFIHHFFPDKSGITDDELLPLIEKTLDRDNPREWYYALMDYGSFLAKQVENPNRRSKHYTKQSKFEGSRRQLRGEILKLLKSRPSVTITQIDKIFPQRHVEIENVMGQLVREGFLNQRKNRYYLTS